MWHDFATLAGESSDWVSGFVAFSVGTTGALHSTVHDVLGALLRRQRRSGGWAYNERVPPDCDSTAWVLMAMATTTVRRPSAILRALEYILRHACGPGFATFAAEDGIHHFIGTAPEQTAGWCDVHTCVTALATQALLRHGLKKHSQVRAALTALKDGQNEDGVWTSYWWQGHAYATAQSLRALAAANELTEDIWHRATNGLTKLQSADGGFGDFDEPSHAFATAMSLTSLLTRPDHTLDGVIDAAVDWLLEAQGGGHWSGVPILRIPRPMVSEPYRDEFERDGLSTGAIVRDQYGIFTTAAALAALVDYRNSVNVRR